MKRTKSAAKPASALGRRLRDYIAKNRASQFGKGMPSGQTSARQIAGWLTSQGKPATDNTVLSWMAGRNEPGSGYVLLLEELLGMPWRDIVDPDVSDPTPEDADRFRRLIRLSPRERAALKAKVFASPPVAQADAETRRSPRA